MRDFYMAQARALEIEAETGITVRQQAEMPLDEWSRLAYGKTPAQAALSAYFAQEEPGKPSTPAAELRSSAPASDSLRSNSDTPQAASAPPAGIDFNDLPYEEQRRIAGIGQHVDRGIFSGVLSGSDEYRDAAARHAGRTQYIQGTNDVAEMMAKRGRTIVKQNEIPPSGRRTFGY